MRLPILAFLVFALAVPAFAQQSVAVADVALTLPNDWKGTVESDESRAPYNSFYVFRNTNSESAIDGAELVVQRVIGFDRVERDNFLRGRLSYGYSGLRAINSVPQDEMPFSTARGYKTSGNNRLGNIYFIQHGMTYYAIHFSAPTNTFEAALPVFLDIARSIELPAIEGQ